MVKLGFRISFAPLVLAVFFSLMRNGTIHVAILHYLVLCILLSPTWMVCLHLQQIKPQRRAPNVKVHIDDRRFTPDDVEELSESCLVEGKGTKGVFNGIIFNSVRFLGQL